MLLYNRLPLYIHNIYRKRFLQEPQLIDFLRISTPEYVGIIFDFVHMRIFLVNEGFERHSKQHMPKWVVAYKKFYKKICYNVSSRTISFFIKSTDTVVREIL